MINNRQGGGGRRRGRGSSSGGGGGRIPGNVPSGNRQDNRQRGNAAQLLEKYRQLARDAQMGGDRVQTENYHQFAEHYFRLLNENRARFEEQRPQRADYGDEDEGEDGYDAQADGDGEERGDYRRQRQQPQREYSQQREPRENREPRADREPRENREPRGDREARDNREPRGDRDTRDNREPREARPPREHREPRDYREPREPHGEGQADPRNADERGGEGRTLDAARRPRRPRRDLNGDGAPSVEAVNDQEDGAARLALDILPPAIGIAPAPADVDAGDEEAPRPRRRTRRPRAEGDGDLAPAA